MAQDTFPPDKGIVEAHENENVLAGSYFNAEGKTKTFCNLEGGVVEHVESLAVESFYTPLDLGIAVEYRAIFGSRCRGSLTEEPRSGISPTSPPLCSITQLLPRQAGLRKRTNVASVNRRPSHDMKLREAERSVHM